MRLIDVSTSKNILTLWAHVCGVHDVSIDPQTGIIASASYDYAVHLWDLDKKDVIFLRGEDEKTKGYCKFTRRGSLLAIGEYDYYSGPHSFYIYDLKKQRNVFEFAMPEDIGVSAMTISSDSNYLAVAASDRNSCKPTRLYIVQLGTYEIVREHVFKTFGFGDLQFVDGHNRLVAIVDDREAGNYDAELIEIDIHSGEIKWREFLGRIGATLANHPTRPELAVAFKNPEIRIYDTESWNVIRTISVDDEGEGGSICSLAYSNNGQLLAYGLSSGVFQIVPSE